MKLNFSLLLNGEPSDDYLTGELNYRLPGGAVVQRPVEVRVRGKFRRRVCEFPPLKLKFDEEVLRQAGLDPTYRSIKLVTHCLDDRFAAKENVLREYLIYKLYSLVTEQSYRVQLARLTYVDSQGERPAIRRYGFFIEDPDEMAARVGGEECEDCLNPAAEDIALKEATLMATFQYMIGNADWNIQSLRNVKLIRRPGDQQDLLVPYDFDFAGIINASYALPRREVGQISLRDRSFLGYPVEDDLLRWSFNYLKFKEKEIFDYVASFRMLSRDSRVEIRDYLRSFFDYLDFLNINKSDNLYERFANVPLRYPFTAENPTGG